MDPRLETAAERRAHTERVLALVTNLRALLAGHMTRADMSRWLSSELWPPGSGQRGPFIKQPAVSVYDSLSLDERWQGQPLVRDVDLRAYLRWLIDGESLWADGDPLFVLAIDIEEFAAQTGTDAIRWWHSGLGWWVSLQFGSPVSGHAYVIHSGLDHPGVLGIHKQVHHDRHEAIIDLFEALAIDEQDVTHLHRDIDLTRLPTWTLWREDFNNNRFEVARYHSYAKARAQERVFTDRGHHQTYWVEPA